jgi:glutamate carboxypeptidase
MPLTPSERAVCGLIAARHGALLEDLRLHVALPTGGGNRAALDESRERLTQRAESLGAQTRLVPGDERPAWLYAQAERSTQAASAPPPPTAVCRRPGRGREVLLAGHLDTVHDPAGAFNTLTLSGDGRTATGPGCVDMKGGLVIALAALEALEEAGERLAFTLLLNSDEETGSYHSFRAIFDEASRVHAAGGIGIALEPAAANGALVVERAGSGQFMVECRGRSAHVGRDFASGVSAVGALARVIVAAESIGDPGAGVIVNIGPLAGNSATNVVPDRARAWGNVRFASPGDASLVEQQLHALAKTPGLPAGATVHVHTSFGRPAKPLTPAVQRFAGLCTTAAADLGQSLPTTTTAGVCDGNIMQHAGLTTLDTLGVRGGGLHTPDEWIEIPSLVERCQLLALVMMRCASGQGP